MKSACWIGSQCRSGEESRIPKEVQYLMRKNVEERYGRLALGKQRRESMATGDNRVSIVDTAGENGDGVHLRLSAAAMPRFLANAASASATMWSSSGPAPTASSSCDSGPRWCGVGWGGVSGGDSTQTGVSQARHGCVCRRLPLPASWAPPPPTTCGPRNMPKGTPPYFSLRNRVGGWAVAEGGGEGGGQPMAPGTLQHPP